MGDRFQVQHVIDECEKFLTSNAKVPVMKKLLISDQYGLMDLQEEILGNLQKVKNIKKLTGMHGYCDLSNNVKAALYEKMVKLV